ncbi:MAG: penicillin-binding protein [Candidatus Acidiferrales bacterium]
MELRNPRQRWIVLLILAVVWLAVILVRLAWLDLFSYSSYLARAQRQQQHLVEISPERGVIYDRNGHELAISTLVDSCFAIPQEISDPEMVAGLLSRILHISSDEILAHLKESKPFVWIARKLPPEAVARIEALNLKGIYFQREWQRFYPKRELAAHVLGFVNVDEHGQAGVEQEFDKQIRGRPGKVLVMEDARRRWYDRRENAADAGDGIVLTIDETIQYITERALQEEIEKSHARSGVAIVQDPNTGEILALASWPTYNPNEASHASDDAKMDRAVVAAFEPGSTFKLILMSSAIGEHVVRPSDLFDCQMGKIEVAGRVIHDWHPFGVLSVEGILAHSSDVGSIKVALKLGAEKYYEHIREFGFGELTGIDLPGENRGLLRRVENWTPSSIGSLAIGQEINVTGVQLISAVSAIANGGLLYRPHVVKEIRNGNTGEIPAEPAPQHALDATTGATLREMMEEVTLDGTGKLSQLVGYTVGGKTGTAQKIDPDTGRYYASKYVTSFVGFAPVNNPALTVLVELDSPEGLHHGGTVAAPVFKRIAQESLAYLNVPHDLAVSPRLKTAVLREPASQDEEEIPAAGAATKQASSSVTEAPGPTVALAPGEGVEVPQLLGQSVRAVVEACSQLGFVPVLIGNGIAVQQSPEAGTRVPAGSKISVRFGSARGAAPASSRGSK